MQDDAGCTGTSAGRETLAVLLALAVAVRVVMALAYPFTTRATDLGPDGIIYWHHAQGYAREAPPWPLLTPERAPGYPLVLAMLFRLLGESLTLARTVNAAFWLATLGLTGVLGRRAAGPWAGLFAAAIYAWSEPFYYIKFVSYETQFAFLTLAGVLATQRAVVPPRPRAWALAAGALLAASGLTQSKMMPMLVVALAAILWPADAFGEPEDGSADPAPPAPAPPGTADSEGQGPQNARRTRLASSCALVCGAGLILLPWMLRNRWITGRWIIVSADGPRSFINGNNRYATGTAAVPGDLAALRGTGSEVQQDASLVRAALGFIAHHPLYWLTRVAPRKHYFLWNLADAVPMALHCVALLGFLVLASTRRLANPWLIASPIAILEAVALAFHGEGHYRFAALPFVDVCAAGLLALAVAPAPPARLARRQGDTIPCRIDRAVMRFALPAAGTLLGLLMGAAIALSPPEVIQADARAQPAATWPGAPDAPGSAGAMLEVRAWINAVDPVRIDVRRDQSIVASTEGPIDLSVWYYRRRFALDATPGRYRVRLTLRTGRTVELGPFDWPPPAPCPRGGILLASTGSGPAR